MRLRGERSPAPVTGQRGSAKGLHVAQRLCFVVTTGLVPAIHTFVGLDRARGWRNESAAARFREFVGKRLWLLRSSSPPPGYTGDGPSRFKPGGVPVIHAFPSLCQAAWMAGAGPGHDDL